MEKHIDERKSVMLSLILIIIGVFLICAAFAVKNHIDKLSLRYTELYGDGRKYCACILDSHTEKLKLPSGKEKKAPVLILQFRIEEQKRTVVHRFTEKFYKKYSRGDKVNIIFCESMPADRAVIENDSVYTRYPPIAGKIFTAVCVPGAILIIVGTVIMFF